MSVFPIEIRAEAIGAFFAIAQAFGAAIMVIGGLVEIAFGVNAEGKSLETVARPLTAVTE